MSSILSAAMRRTLSVLVVTFSFFLQAGNDRDRIPPSVFRATACLENRLLRLRLQCEATLDDVTRLKLRKDQSEACRRLRKYITCIDLALTSTRCRQDRYVFGREVERRKRQVDTYNWDCSLQMQNYDYIVCDSQTLLKRHLACGTAFDRAILQLDFQLDQDKEQLCSSLTDYKHCVTPLIKNDACSTNKNLISRLLFFSRAVVAEYQTSCKAIAMKHIMEARQVEDTSCLPEELREKVLTCQQSAYRTIRARDIHSETDICAELDLMKECVDNALKESSCSRHGASKQVANETMAESYARYNVKCRQY